MNGVAGKGVTGPPITLLPSSRIPVTVHAEFTHLAAPQPGSGSPTAAGQISMELQREGSATANRGSQLGLQDDANSATTGVSQLIGVAPGRYWVNATAYNGYIASVTSGGVNLLEQPLVVSADGSASPIEVVLRDDVASLSATLGSSLQPAAQDGTTPIYLQVVPESGDRDQPDRILWTRWHPADQQSRPGDLSCLRLIHPAGHRLSGPAHPRHDRPRGANDHARARRHGPG